MEDTSTTEIELSPKEKTLEIIDSKIRGIEAQITRMHEFMEKGYENGAHIVYVVDEELAGAEINRLKSARKRVVKDLDPLPKYDWVMHH